MGAVAHDAQAQAGFGADHRRKRGAVVADGEHQMASAIGQANFDVFGFGMFDGVGHGFLRNFIELTDAIGFERRRLGFTLKTA